MCAILFDHSKNNSLHKYGGNSKQQINKYFGICLFVVKEHKLNNL